MGKNEGNKKRVDLSESAEIEIGGGSAIQERGEMKR